MAKQNLRPAKRRPESAGKAKVSAAALDKLIEEATVDCHDDSEALGGFATMIEESLELPFETEVLGVEVRVNGIDQTEPGYLVAVCARGRFRQAIPLLDLPLPNPPPRGAEWIEAYRRWARGGKGR